jgi:lipopolysaccharide heptosyltransferase II
VKPLSVGDVRGILIRANNWIGDVVMITPAVRAIREHFRSARISILAKSWVVETLRGSPFYDDLIEYDDEGAHHGAAGLVRLMSLLRGRRFDLAVLFQKAFEAAALAFTAGIRFRVGYATDFRSALLTHALLPPPPDTHHIDVFLGIARALDCPVRDPLPSFHLDDPSRRRAEGLLDEAGRIPDRPLVAMHSGASKEPRAWHPERFALLGRRLADHVGARIVLLGGRPDVAIGEEIRRRLPDDSILATGADLTIKEMAGILERCDLFIGNDSGPMHVAAALDVPTVGLFGPGSPRRTAPRARSGRVVSVTRDYPCAPCRQNFFRECSAAPSEKPFCLEEISVDDVEEAALGLLRSGRPIRAPISGGTRGILPGDPAQA